ncbi:MAG: ATP-binding protein [Anaerolineales bacterium]|jgi:PAS domain S-box-containing protein
MKKISLPVVSLRTQMIMSFVALAILTAAAAGLPAVWSNNEQIDRQAWAQVDQGIRAARALYIAKEGEVINFATLTAQRPTLMNYLSQGDKSGLTSYLIDLQSGAGFDLITICDLDDVVVAYTTEDPLVDACLLEESSTYSLATQGGETEVWLLASYRIHNEGENLGKVIVGMRVDDEFAHEMRSETGLEHSIYLAGQPVASSFDVEYSTLADIPRRVIEHITSGSAVRTSFTLDDNSYYATRLSLGELDLFAEVALLTTELIAIQRSQALFLIGSIFAAALLASLLGAFLARRISQPLVHLSNSAATLSRENLDFSISLDTSVREVATLAQALEGARIDLKLSLDNLQKEIEWGSNLLESIVEGIVTLDEDNRILYFSSGAERITGLDRDQAINKPIEEVFQLVEGESIHSLIPSPGQKNKVTVVDARQREITIAVTGARLIPSEAKDSYIALVFRDVSEEEAMNQLLGRFLSNVAHEFRTPLSALEASIELLMEQAPDLNKDEMQELLTSLHLGILGLETLIDNLLEAASIEARQFRISVRPSDLRNIIANAVHTMNPLLIKYGQKIEVGMPASIPLVYADPRRTVQVLVNLLSNANKFGPSDSEIAVNVTVDRKNVKIAVTDQGEGIPDELKSDVFNRFIRPGGNDNNAKMGAGLGLSVVKAIVEAQDGDVGVDDREGGGAIFWFTLPLAKET